MGLGDVYAAREGNLDSLMYILMYYFKNYEHIFIIIRNIKQYMRKNPTNVLQEHMQIKQLISHTLELLFMLCGGKWERKRGFKGNRFQKYFQKNLNPMHLDYFECVFL